MTMNFETYKSMGVSTCLVFDYQENGRLAIGVMDIASETILLYFVANSDGAKTIQQLKPGDNQFILPGIDIKEMARGLDTGDWPKWLGKL